MTEAGTWVVTVWPDRDYHDLVLARQRPDSPAAPEFPAPTAPREIVLRPDEMRVGRVGAPPGTDPADAPEIDLGDPGVSHLHAVLLSLPRDRWVVIDAGSTNGTTLNYAEEPLTPDTPVPLSPGDHIHVGAWTTLTVDRR